MSASLIKESVRLHYTILIFFILIALTQYSRMKGIYCIAIRFMWYNLWAGFIALGTLALPSSYSPMGIRR